MESYSEIKTNKQINAKHEWTSQTLCQVKEGRGQRPSIRLSIYIKWCQKSQNYRDRSRLAVAWGKRQQ